MKNEELKMWELCKVQEIRPEEKYFFEPQKHRKVHKEKQ
jgi:hypothetical protein